ncbi:MAG TPA: putative lipase [Dehalococcoidia bacterium]|nr:putative lipase [Dehalococcoidia bacterium]
MFAGIVGRLLLTTVIGLCLQTTLPASAQSAAEVLTQVKELNFLFLHGMGGSSCSMQLLSDHITEQLPAFAAIYERDNPDIEIRMNKLIRCYPGYEDIETWAQNITGSIDEHFGDKQDLIIVGHSMGGKAALYAVAQNINNLADKTAAVITINSPIKSLGEYYIPGGGEVVDYCRTVMLGTDEGICESVTLRDSSQDGEWVSQNKHWLAFIAAEGAPLSEQFDRAGVDIWPRDMDDGAIPLSAQYSDAADVFYYGQHGHSDFGSIDEVAALIADRTLRYIFGMPIEYSVLYKEGNLEHKADWLLGTDHWTDVVGEVVISSGRLEHSNKYWTRWLQWEDVLGECPPQSQRSSILVTRLSIPILTSIKEVRWYNPDDPEDCRLYIRTGAAPRTTVRLDWTIYQQDLLPEETPRSHYEVEITDGTPLAAIRQVSWMTVDPSDIRLRIWSEAQSPFRWFKAALRTYHRESRQRQVIDEISTKVIIESIPGN